MAKDAVVAGETELGRRGRRRRQRWLLDVGTPWAYARAKEQERGPEAAIQFQIHQDVSDPGFERVAVEKERKRRGRRGSGGKWQRRAGQEPRGLGSLVSESLWAQLG